MILRRSKLDRLHNIDYILLAMVMTHEVVGTLYPGKGGPSKRKIRRLTKTFPQCQDWRKSTGLDTDYKIRIN